MKLINCFAPLALITILMAGCTSAIGLKENKAFASTETVTESTAVLRQTIKDVFIEQGFSVKVENPTTIVLSQAGGTASTVLYGTSWNTELVTIEPHITIVDMDDQRYKLNLEVFMREHKKDGRPNEPWQLRRNGKGKYQELMDEIKSRIESK